MIPSRERPSICATTAVEATFTSTTWSRPTRLKLFWSAITPWISWALIIAVRTSRTASGVPLRESQSATARIPPRLSEGWPHSAASQVSLKSSQRIAAPMLKAACTGSSSKRVPGTRAPFVTTVPGTSGPSSLVQAGDSSASRRKPQAAIGRARALQLHRGGLRLQGALRAHHERFSLGRADLPPSVGVGSDVRISIDLPGESVDVESEGGLVRGLDRGGVDVQDRRLVPVIHSGLSAFPSPHHVVGGRRGGGAGAEHGGEEREPRYLHHGLLHVTGAL